MSRSERISSVVLVIFGLFIAYYSRKYLKLGMLIRPDAGFIPFYLGIALVVLGMLWFFNSLMGRKVSAAVEKGCAGETTTTGKERRNLVLFRFVPAVIFVLLYAWFIERIGYFMCTFLFMLGWQKVVERQKWVKTLLISILCAGTMYVLFANLLKIALPEGAWFS